MAWFRKNKKLLEETPTFSGVCYVREFTADGIYVGKCEHATYGGMCPRHQDVTQYLLQAGWPRDFNLPKYDGLAWAEELRTLEADGLVPRASF